MLHPFIEGGDIFTIVLICVGFDNVESLGVVSRAYGTVGDGDSVGGGVGEEGEEEDGAESKDHGFEGCSFYLFGE